MIQFYRLARQWQGITPHVHSCTILTQQRNTRQTFVQADMLITLAERAPLSPLLLLLALSLCLVQPESSLSPKAVQTPASMCQPIVAGGLWTTCLLLMAQLMLTWAFPVLPVLPPLALLRSGFMVSTQRLPASVALSSKSFLYLCHEGKT
eukprot:GHRR01015116.1.p1 GENE.GHRR01015116.1~~GHRR01015116.1.p1  ORF type:complete len:150 (-),score=27.30 GHRR01015116.1:377-826(-)